MYGNDDGTLWLEWPPSLILVVKSWSELNSSETSLSQTLETEQGGAENLRSGEQGAWRNDDKGAYGPYRNIIGYPIVISMKQGGLLYFCKLFRSWIEFPFTTLIHLPKREMYRLIGWSPNILHRSNRIESFPNQSQRPKLQKKPSLFFSAPWSNNTERPLSRTSGLKNSIEP